MPSMIVVSASGGAVAAASSRLWRRFWPVSLTTRSRLAAGLKSTPKLVPLRATVSWPTLAACGVGVEGVDAAGVADAVELAVLDAEVDPDQGLVADQVLDLADAPGPPGAVGVEPDQPSVGGQPDHLQAAAVVAARAVVGTVQVAELAAVGDRGDREHAHGAEQQQPPSECLAHRMRLPCLVGPGHRGPGRRRRPWSRRASQVIRSRRCRGWPATRTFPGRAVDGRRQRVAGLRDTG